MKTEHIARICHEANKAYCSIHGDVSQKHWDDAEQWQRDSAKKGVQFALENPGCTPEDQHIAWMADKVNDGWVYGEVKDPVKKQHPCLVEYSELPMVQRGKDHLFRGIVDALAPFLT